MIRALKGTLALTGVLTLGLLLRWTTAGAVNNLRTYDLESMTVVVVSTVAWIAYSWLALAVLLTALEQLPGVLGALSGAIARRITTRTARTLLRSTFGVAALAPLTTTAAQATPAHSPTTSVEPASTVRLSTPNPQWATNEPGSTVHLSAPARHPRTTEPTVARQPSTPNPQWGAVEPGSTVHLGRSAQPETTPGRPDQQRPKSATADSTSRTDRQLPPAPGRPADPQTPATPGRPADRQTLPASGRAVRVGVPDRPGEGAGTRYMDLRAGVAGRVVVRAGDTLWGLAARELGAGASDAAVARRWEQWYQANRSLIGPDPDLILPGQVLTVPPAHVPHTPQEK